MRGFFFSSAFSLGLSLCSISLFLSPQPQAPFPSVKVMEFFNGTCVKHGAAVHARPLSTEVWMLILEADYKWRLFSSLKVEKDNVRGLGLCSEIFHMFLLWSIRKKHEHCWFFYNLFATYFKCKSSKIWTCMCINIIILFLGYFCIYFYISMLVFFDVDVFWCIFWWKWSDAFKLEQFNYILHIYLGIINRPRYMESLFLNSYFIMSKMAKL